MPIKTVRTHLDYQGHTVQNMALHPRSEDPNAMTVGQIYFNVNDNLLKLYHEGRWNNLANEKYVDYRPQIKTLIKVVSVTNEPLSNVSVIDGVTLSDGDRVLLTNQTSTIENGIYTFNSGNLSRSLDANSGHKMLPGSLMTVISGTEYSNTIWAVTNTSEAILGTDSLIITQVGGTTAIVPIEKGGTNNTTFLDQKILIYDETTNSIVSSLFTLNSLVKTVAFDITGQESNFVLTHSMSTIDVVIQLYDKADGRTIEAQTTRTSPNEISISLSSPPLLNTYRVIVQGSGIILDPGVNVINGGDANNSD